MITDQHVAVLISSIRLGSEQEKKLR